MDKIKQFIQSEKGKDVLIVVIVILVGLGSFELGRLSKENDSGGIKIEYPGQNQNQKENDSTSPILSQNRAIIKTSDTIQNLKEKNFFASNRGTKYYSVGCSAGNNLKPENRIYFTSREEAERAGYELSSGCK